MTAVNKDLALRYDVLVHVTANEQANADYDPNKHEVSLPYWFAQEVRNALQKAQPTLSPAELDHKTAQGMTGVLLHEFGHVMVHEYNLPVLGAEETVADTFGIIAMVYGAHQVPDIVGIVDAFGAFLKEFGTEIDAVGPPDVFDDHTPPETRSARLHCLVYGSDPKRFAAVSGDIPAADLPLCVADFKEALAGWTAVLKKHATN